MNERTRRRVLLAASLCETKNEREAALVGALAASLIHNDGKLSPTHVAAVAADRLGWAMSVATDMDRTFKKAGVVNEDGTEAPLDPLSVRLYEHRGYPTMPEIRNTVEMFRRYYEGPDATPIAA